ncbi:MAG: hypothetical protein K8R90_07835, partial [Candidatus Cloacimonetes bacterium]|nr:hypothetical protein [Candidatus Cloacimonadota bacterium]
MFVVSQAPDSWRQVARVVERELPRLEVAALVVHAHSEEQMAAFLFEGVRTVFVCDEESAREAWSRRFPDALCIGKPHKTPPLAPASPFPLEFLKISSEM